MKKNFQSVLMYPLKKVNNIVNSYIIVLSSPMGDEKEYTEEVKVFNASSNISPRNVLSTA